MTTFRDSQVGDGSQLRRAVIRVLLAATLAALISGGVAWLAGSPGSADICWAAGTLVAIIPAVWWVVAALRRGRVGADVIAVLALVGTLAVREYLAGALIGVMLATGQALELAAERRAAKDLRSLLERAPRVARRRTEDGLETVPLDEVMVGDLLVVGPGEMLPVDARIASDSAVLDESVLTGESVHTEYRTGQAVRSGAVNAGGALEIRATATASDSTYAGIVRLAQQAAGESAPVVRLADRVAAWFLPLALAVAGLPGCSADRRSARWRCSWSRRHVRCCWQRRSRSCPASRGHHVSALSCGRRSAGEPRQSRHSGAGQDRHGDHGPAPGHRCSGRPRLDAAGGPAVGGVGRPGFATCDGQSDRRGSA